MWVGGPSQRDDFTKIIFGLSIDTMACLSFEIDVPSLICVLCRIWYKTKHFEIILAGHQNANDTG